MNKETEKINPVALHEVSHAAGAEVLGANILKQTIIPEGNTLGYVITSFERFPFHEKLFRMLATKFFGGLGLEKLGFNNPWKGADSDLYQADFLSKIISKFVYLDKIKPETVRSWALSLARSALPSRKILTYRAYKLELKGTIT
ncbi:MAG: hypothetical protein V1808_00125 [Candidatus Daviesbacteria bacterium]